MTQKAYNYARALYELSVPAAAIQKADELLSENQCLVRILDHPEVMQKEKDAVIDKLFPAEVRNFIKVLSSKRLIHEAGTVFAAYKTYAAEKEGMIDAELTYVTKPTVVQLAGIEAFLRKNHHASSVRLHLKADEKLGGGFILRAGDIEYDWSLAGRLKSLSQRLVRR